MKGAFLVHEGRAFFSRSSGSSGRFLAQTAVTDLIQGIYELEPELARKILRNRIFSTEAPTPMCQGMVRVAAKRMTGPVEELELPENRVEVSFRVPPAGAISVSSSSSRSHPEWMQQAWGLALSVRREGAQYEQDRPVAAILVSERGEVLGAALNSNARNRTLHAEVNLVQAYCAANGRRISRGARIYVTLRCCKMCAGMIWYASEDPFSVEIYYGEDDPGADARGTVLQAGSNERRRLCSQKEDVLRVIEKELPKESFL